ncbi:MAG: class I SAM-dependent methyltransferase [Deltaproteobacteria bacterium]|nr:class I SAM-dependent methyltransferase [Deltaproteobacteria bacterium]
MAIDDHPLFPYTPPMTSSLTILWPKLAAPDIAETRFSYDFCRRLSRQLCTGSGQARLWVECSNDAAIGDILPRIQGDVALLVTQPEIVVSASTIEILERCLEKGYCVCGPVYNQTPFPHQQASLPAAYVDIQTYLEVADILALDNGHKAIAVESLDPACILFRTRILTEIPSRTVYAQLSNVILNTGSDPIAVAPGALVHSGFTKGFETERIDLVGLVPEGVKCILDIGCAKGGYGKALRQERPEIILTGVELNPILAEAAVGYYDEIINSPIEEAGIRGPFDLINCGDLLEHLQDPWGLLKTLSNLLKDNGYLILSIPNAGHWSMVKALLRGDFQYVPLGLICIGHLRWFTETSIRDALQHAGFTIEVFQREQIPPTPEGERFIREMCTGGYGDERSLRTNEFIIRAVKRIA